MAFHRPYKRLGVEKGDELRVAGDDRKTRTVKLEGADGQSVAWEPNRVAARVGGGEVYRSEEIELRAGDRIRWTRNDVGLGLVNSGAAEVAAVRDGQISFRVEDGRTLDLAPGDPAPPPRPRLGVHRARVPVPRGRYRNRGAGGDLPPHLTTQKSFYIEISRARDRAELVTDDNATLKEQLEAATGERIAGLRRWSRTGRRGATEEMDGSRAANQGIGDSVPVTGTAPPGRNWSRAEVEWAPIAILGHRRAEDRETRARPLDRIGVRAYLSSRGAGSCCPLSEARVL